MRTFVKPIMLIAAASIAGCGGDTKPEPQGGPLQGAVELERPKAGSPDGGTSAGHGSEFAVATTSADVFSFVGRVDAGSKVSVDGGVARTEPSGRFTVATTSPAGGTKPLKIEATKAGRRPWAFEVRLNRAAPERVRVPERDEEAPSAALALWTADGDRAAAIQPSPSRAGERPAIVTLDEPKFRATAAVRDARSGTGRIRISVESVTKCGDESRTDVQVIPPAQIVNIAIPAGAFAPVERQRTKVIELDAPSSCSVTGEALAEGTDSHGRQAVTAHIGFKYP